MQREVKEGNGFWTHVLVHVALLGSEWRGSAGDAARSLARGGCRGLGGLLEAADRDFETGDTLVAGNRRQVTRADGIEECDQLGAQRFVVADRQMPHRITSVGLEAETFGHLARQEIAPHIFAAGRNRY